jgi:hypothetical protein
MAITSKQITTAGNPPVQVYEADGQNAITTMIFCNTSTGVAVNIDVYVVSDSSGYAPGPQTQILKTLPIPPTESFVMDSEKFILEDLDTIHVRADQANAITVTISSVSTA